MKICSAVSRAVLAFIFLFIFVNLLVAEPPAGQTKNYNSVAAANPFSFVTSGAIIKLKSASIAKDGTITARFTLTDSNGQGLDINGVQTPGITSVRLVAAYIPNGKSQYVAYTTSVANPTTNTNAPQTQAGTDSGGTFALVD